MDVTPMINIFGVTAEQHEMLDMLWSMDTINDIDNWIDELDAVQQQQARLLRDLIVLASLDDLVVDQDDCKDAAQIIAQLSSNC